MAILGTSETATYDAATNAKELLPQTWSKVIHRALYQRSKFMKNVTMYEKLHDGIHIRLLKRLGTSAMAAGHSGIGLVYQTNTEVDVELSPEAVYLATAFPENTESRADFTVSAKFRKEVENAMEEGLESNFLEVVATATNQVGGPGAHVDAATLRSQLALLQQASYGNVESGDAGIRLLLHVMEQDDIMAVPEWNNAEIVGDGKQSHRTGTLLKANGTTVQFSTAVYVDPTTLAAYNPLWVPDGVGQSWNTKTKVKEQEVELQKRLIAYADFGVGIVRNELIRTLLTASQ